MSPKKKVLRIDIDLRRCKGCEICVGLCPKSVLVLKNRKSSVARLEDCIGCDLCQLRCPDFAIEVVHEGEDASAKEEPENG